MFDKMTESKLAGVGVTALAVLAGAICLAWFFRSCQREPPPKIPPATQRSIDSLVITKPVFDSTQVAGRQQVARDTLVAVSHRRRAVQAEASAQVSKATADSLAVAAEKIKQTDSAVTAWKDAYQARTLEAESWRLAAVRNDSAYQSERRARLGLAQLYGADTLRRNAVERVNTELQTAILRLQQPCKVIGPISCPSRTVTMAVSLTAGAVIGFFAARR